MSAIEEDRLKLNLSGAKEGYKNKIVVMSAKGKADTFFTYQKKKRGSGVLKAEDKKKKSKDEEEI